MPFFVYFGYSGPDHHDSSEYPTYECKEFRSQQEVLDHHAEFIERMHKECSHIIYRVIHGQELSIEPVEKVTKYKLVADNDE